MAECYHPTQNGTSRIPEFSHALESGWDPANALVWPRKTNFFPWVTVFLLPLRNAR